MELESLFYKLGKICLVIGAIGIAVLLITDFEIISWYPKCDFLSKTGLYCPGCGGTRAVKSLLRGDLIRSFLFHPFVPYSAIMYVVFMLYVFLKKHFKLFKKVFPVQGVICIGVGVLLLQWIVKVILQFVL